jgi:hypothetical protein
MSARRPDGQTAVDVEGTWRDTQEVRDTEDTQDTRHKARHTGAAVPAVPAVPAGQAITGAVCRVQAKSAADAAAAALGAWTTWTPGPPGPRWARPMHYSAALGPLCPIIARWLAQPRATNSFILFLVPAVSAARHSPNYTRCLQLARPGLHCSIAPLLHCSIAPAFTRSIVRPPNPPNPLAHSLTHSPTHPRTHSPARPLTNSLTHSSCVCVCVCVCVCALSAPSSRSLCLHTTIPRCSALLGSALLPAIFRHHQPWRMLLPLSPTYTHPSA